MMEIVTVSPKYQVVIPIELQGTKLVEEWLDHQRKAPRSRTWANAQAARAAREPHQLQHRRTATDRQLLGHGLTHQIARFQRD